MPSPDVKKIGKYEILAELGQGGFGRVYRAFDPTVGRPVAIKILTVEGNHDLLTRFRNEATSAGNLRHRNIVTVYDFGEHSGRPYLVMELLEGEDLTQIISSGAHLTLLQKMNIMDQVADGLECAHRNGVVHRDVKPANIRLLPDGTVKIMDFGIARVNRDRETKRLTQQGDLIGTILYMSPEQFGGADADALCDIFAFGVTYFELLTGKHPFRSPDPRAVMFKITMEDPPSVRSLVPECPEALEQILHRALQKDRELRYHSLRDVRLDTEPLILELKQERAKDLTDDAQNFSSAKDPHKALSNINEALDLDPSNREARQLREVIQRQLQKEAVQPRIDAMLQTAQEQLASRSIAMAVQTLESALKLDQTNTAIRGSLDAAKEQLQRFKEAARLAMSALADVNRREWAAASEKASEAVRLDPSNEEGARVLDAIQKHFTNVLSKIDRHIEEGAVDVAISELQQLAVLRPESDEIPKRLTLATARKVENDRIQAVVQNVHQLLEQSRFQEAIHALAAAHLPDQPDILSLRKQAEDGLAAVLRAEGIEQAARNIESLLAASNIDEALRQSESALRSYPDEKTIVDVRARGLAAKAAQERELAVRSVVSNCNRVRSEGRFSEALEIVQAGIRTYAGEPVLLALRQEVQEAWESSKRAEALRQVTAEVEQLLAQGKHQQAVELLQKASTQYRGEESLPRLLGQAQEELRSHQRREAIKKAAGEAQDRAGREDFDGGLNILKEALKSWPGESVLLELRQKILQDRARWERQRTVAEVAQQCEPLRQAKHFGAALEVIQDGLRKYSDEPTFLELQRQVQEQWAREKRTESVRQRTEECQRLLEQGQPQAAVESLEQALEQFPGEEQLTELLAEARQAQRLLEEETARKAAAGRLQAMVSEAERRIQQSRFADAVAGLASALKAFPEEPRIVALMAKATEAQRAERIEKAARTAEAMRDASDFAGALGEIDGALLLFPDETRLTGLRAAVSAAKAEWERDLLIKEVVEECDVFRANQRMAEALEVVQAGLLKHGQEPVLVRLELEVRKQCEQQQRTEAVRRIAADGQRLIDQGANRQAVDLLEKASGQYPEEEDLQKLLALAKEELRGQQRRVAVEQASLAAQSRVEQKDFQRAKEILEKALEAWPAESRLVELLQAAKAGEAKERRKAVEQVLQECNQLRANHRWAEALKVVQAGLKKHEQEPDLVRLEREVAEQSEKEARQEHERRQRAEAVMRAAEKGKQLLDRGRAKQAVETLEKACGQYPEESELQTLLAKAWEELRAQQRRQAVEQVVREAQGWMEQQNFGKAVEILEKALDAGPEEKQLSELLQAAKAKHATNEQRESVEAVARECNQLRANHQLAQALEVVQAGLRKYKQDPALIRLEQEVREQWESQRRAEGVERATQEAQSCLERQDFKGALQILEKALASWPGENALAELVQSAKAAQAGRDREQALDAIIRQCHQLVANGRFPKALKTIQAGLLDFPGEPVLVQLEREVREQSERQPQKPDVTPAGPGLPSVLRTHGLLIGAGLVALLAGVLIVPRLLRTDRGATVILSSDIAGASVTVGGKSCVTPECSLNLPAGTYKLTATKTGFKALSQTVSVPKGNSELKIPLVFEPLPQLVQVNTNFASGRVFLDNRPGQDLRDGQLTLSGISAGTHTLRVTGGDAQFETKWRSTSGASPELESPINAKNVQATVIASVGGKGTISCNCEVQSIQVDGNAVASSNSGTQGVQVTDLKEGARRIGIGDRSVVVDVKPNPALNVFLTLDREVGTVVIETSEDAVKVYINGREYHRLTEHRLLRIPLDVGRYVIGVKKDGFRNPSQQTVDLGKREDKQLAFVLAPLPAVLEIVGALPGAQVKVDGRVVGETGSKGSFRAEVSPGNHLVELTKADYTGASFTTEFGPGRTIRPSRPSVAMARVIKPPPPAENKPPEPKPTEAQDWDLVRGSNNPDELDDFIRKHPGGANVEDARNRISQLRRQADAAAARQAEQDAWNAVDKSNKAALQDFLSRYGAGPHAQDARGLIAGIEKQQADAIAAAQRPKEQKPKEPDQPNPAVADFQSIQRTLSSYEAAYNAKDFKALQSVWQSMPKNMAAATRREFGDAKAISFQIHAVERPSINGDSATVNCTRTLSLTTKFGQRQDIAGERVKVTLGRAGTGWLIQSITPF